MKGRKFALLVGSIVCISVLALIFSRLRTETPEIVAEQELPLVNAITPKAHKGRVTIRGNGTVRPLQEVTLVAEVSGRIVWVAKEFVTGGSFRRGQEILRIDPTDYVNAVTVAQAEVVRRQFDLLKAEEEMAISREEWALLESRTGVQRQADNTELGSLVFKEPHYKAAEAQLQSAQARLQDAETRLRRTRIIAPYNGLLRNKTVDFGQFVGPGQVLSSYYGTDAVEISIPVSGRDITLLGNISDYGDTSMYARLIVRYAGGEHEWMGVVHRTEGMLTESTRTLNVIVRVQNPYDRSDVRPPLLVGTFVTAYLEGRYFDQYYTLPRETLKEDSVVWIVRNGRLRPQPVEIIQEVDDTLYVSNGITVKDSVVTDVLNIVTNGMRVRTEPD